MRYATIDIETCGLDPVNCSILSFAMVLDDLSNPKPLGELPSMHCIFTAPEELYTGEPYALQMNVEIFRWLAGVDTESVAPSIVDPMYLDREIFQFLANNSLVRKWPVPVALNIAGKNVASFDLPFLKEQTSFYKAVKPRHRTLDPAMLYARIGDAALPNLQTCLERAGLKGDVQHDALQDCYDVIRLIRVGGLEAAQ